MKYSFALVLLLSVAFAAPLPAKNTGTAADKKAAGKTDDVEADTAVVTAKKLYDDACKELKDAETAKAPADKIKQLTKAKEAAAKELKEVRQDARKRLAEKKADADKAKRGGKK